MPNMTIGSKISASRFDFNPSTRELSAEISMLSHGGVNPLGRLYADAADIGFVLISNVTGKEVEFQMVSEQRDGDGDVAYWHFEPVATEHLTHPNLKGTHVVILND